LSEHQKIHEEFVTHFVEFTGIWHAKRMVILSEKVWKMTHYIHRHLHVLNHFHSFVLQISMHHFFQNCVSKNNHKIKLVVIHAMDLTKCLTTFSGIFSYLLIDFSKNIHDFFRHKCQMSLGYAELCARYKNESLF